MHELGVFHTDQISVCLDPGAGFRPSSAVFVLAVPGQYFFCGSLVFFLSCVCYDFVSVCSFAPWCRLPWGGGGGGGAGLLALVCDV